MPVWLGIDIGSASVKAAVVRSNYRKAGLVRLVTVDVVAGGTMVEAIRAATVRALDGEKQGADAVAVAIDGSRAAIHRLLLPGTAQKELASVLSYELEAQVPFDLDGAVFDWRILARGTEDGQLPIVAAVARVEDVRARINVVKEAIGQEPERVAVGAFALGALVPYLVGLGDEEAVAIVDLGAKASEVIVFERGDPVFARTLSCGTEGLPATAARLARDIRVSFAGHQSQGGAPPSRVYLCGGGAFVSGAEGFLSGELEIPVQLLPAPSLDATLIGAESQNELPRYAKAMALALALEGRGVGMNLRRGPLAFERGFAWMREKVPVLAGLGAVLFVSFVFSAWSRLHAVHAERDVLESALGAVTKEVLGSEATTAQDTQDLLAKEAALSDEDPMPHIDAFDVMVLLSESIPTSMIHDVEEMDVQKGHVTVRGIVGSIPDAQSISASLSDERCLDDVKIKSTSQAIGTDRQKYVMEFDLKCPEDVRATTKKKKGDTSASASSASGATSSGGK
jgi:general secretion pathway protein L